MPGWIDFQSDVVPSGTVVMNGVEVRVPRYYERKLKRGGDSEVLLALEALEFERHKRGLSTREDNSDERLAVKEQVLRARISFLKRRLGT